MSRSDQSGRAGWRTGRTLLLAALLSWVTVAAAQDGDKLTPQEADAAIAAEPAAETVTPTLVREQRQTYSKLQRIWSRRDIPEGMKPPQAPFMPRNSGARVVSLLAENVEFHVGAGIGYYIDHLEVALVPTKAGAPVDFDDPWSYTIRIIRGKILLRPEQIDALFNHHVLTYTPRSITKVENFTSKNTLKIKLGARLWGVLPPLGALPVTLVGTGKVTEDDRLLYKPQQVTSLGLPLKPLLTAINVPLSALTPLERPGVVLDGNKLYMDPEKLFPPPRLQIDNLSDAELTDKGLILTFTSDTDPDFSQPPVDADSYLWMQSGDAKFFDVLLVNIHMQVINETGNKPLAFDLYHYRAQAAAGKMTVRRDGTLIVKVPNDFPTDVLSAQYPNEPRESTR